MKSGLTFKCVFKIPDRGKIPVGYRAASTYRLLVTATWSNPNILWTTYALAFDTVTKRLPCWYTCLITNDSTDKMLLKLHDIAMQCREDEIYMRISAAKRQAVKLVNSTGGLIKKLRPSPDGFYHLDKIGR